MIPKSAALTFFFVTYIYIMLLIESLKLPDISPAASIDNSSSGTHPLRALVSESPFLIDMDHI